MKKLAIGCGLVTVVLLLLSAGGMWFAKQWLEGEMGDLDRLGELQDQLVETYGEAKEYVPPVDGNYDPARVELYVSIREAVAEQSAVLAFGFDELIDPDREQEKWLRSMITGTRTATALLGQTFGLLAVTDSVLLANEMGQGEYAHLNLIALEGYLGVDAEALAAPLDELDPEDRAAKTLRDLSKDFSEGIRDLLSNHASNLQRAARREHSDDEAIQAYVESVSGGDVRRPFVDAVPPSLLEAFESLSMRLESTRPRTLGAWLAETPAIIDFISDGEGGSRGITINFGD